MIEENTHKFRVQVKLYCRWNFRVVKPNYMRMTQSDNKIPFNEIKKTRGKKTAQNKSEINVWQLAEKEVVHSVI